MDGLILQTGVDNSRVPAGLSQFEAMVEARVRAIKTKLAGIQGLGGEFRPAGGFVSGLNRLNNQLGANVIGANRFQHSLDRMAGTLNTGLGIGTAVGGLALLERSFSRAIEKARQFQTAQLSIAGAIQSSYKIQDPQGQEIKGFEGFQQAQLVASKINADIIKRQAKNILTYEEELGVFQSSIASGARKGLSPEQILDVSENVGIVAKTLGLHGEQIANAARLMLGGGVNVARSTVGRALGVSNSDIAGRSGQELIDFIMARTKGFSAGQPEFEKSIEGILSTLEANLDVFFAKVGTKFFDKVSGPLDGLNDLFEGVEADKFADTLANLFGAGFSALQAIAESPAIPIITRFLEFLSKFGDELLLIGALSKLNTLLLGVAGSVTNLAQRMTSGLVPAAHATATAMEGVGAAGAAAGAASRGPLLLGGTNLPGKQGLWDKLVHGTRKEVAPMGRFESEFRSKRIVDGVGPFADSVGLPPVLPVGGRKNRFSPEALDYNRRAGAYQSRLKAAQAIDAEELSFAIANDQAAARNKSADGSKIAKAAKTGFSKFMAGVGKAAMPVILSGFTADWLTSGMQQSESSIQRGLGGALQAAVPVGVGLASLGALGGPLGLALTGTAAIAGGMVTNVKAAGEQAKTAELVLDKQRRENPEITRMQALQAQANALQALPEGASMADFQRIQNEKRIAEERRLLNENLANSSMGILNAEGSLYGSLAERLIIDKTEKPIDPLMKQALEAIGAKPTDKLSEDQRKQLAEYFEKQGRAVSLKAGGLADIKGLEGEQRAIESQLKALQLGGLGQTDVARELRATAGKKEIDKIFAEFQTAEGDARTSAGFKIDPETLKRAQDWSAAMVKAQEALKGGGKVATPEGVLGIDDVEGIAQLLKRNELSARIDLESLRAKEVEGLQRQSFLATLSGGPRIDNDLKSGLLAAEAGIRSQRSTTFAEIPDEEFAKLVQTVKNKFEQDFNAPLREAQANIELLSIGGDPSNIAKIVGLTIEAAKSKIAQLGRELGKSAQEIKTLQIQAVKKLLGEDLIRQLSDRSTIAGAVGNLFGANRYRKEAELEGLKLKLDPASLKAMGFADFAAFAKEFRRTSATEERLSRLQGGGRSLDDQEARLRQDLESDRRNLETERQFSFLERSIELKQRELEDVGFARAGQRIDMEQQRLQREIPLTRAEGALSYQAAEINTQRAALAPVLQTGPVFSDYADSIRYKVDSELDLKKGFDPAKFEDAYRKSRDLDDQELGLAQIGADIAQQRAGLNLVQVEQEYRIAMEDLTFQIQQRAVALGGQELGRARSDMDYQKGLGDFKKQQEELGFRLGRPGTIPPRLSELPDRMDMSDFLKKTSDILPLKTYKGGAAEQQPAISIAIDSKIMNPGVTSEELEAELRRRVPEIIENFCRDKARTPR